MVGASFIGLPVFTIGVSVAIFLAGLSLHRHEFIIGGMGALISITLGNILKYTIKRSRPDTEHVRLKRYRSYSFPSGHALGSIVAFGFLGLLAAETGQTWAPTLDGALVALIGISRVYLGAHYPSDVVAGWVIGGLGLAVVCLAGGL